MKTVDISELANIKMTCGNEKKYSKVIHDGVVKEWVGIGWIDIDESPKGKKYPVVAEGE